MRDLDLRFPCKSTKLGLPSVRKRMEGAGIDALIVTSPENICYLAGYESVGYFAQQAL